MKKLLCTLIAMILMAVPALAETDANGTLTEETIYANLSNELSYLNLFVGCSGPTHNPDDHIKFGEYQIYSPNKDFTSYSETKAKLLEFCSPYLAMIALGNTAHLYVNDKIYTYDEFLAPFTEGGMPFYDAVKIVTSDESQTLFEMSYHIDDETTLTYNGEYVKINGEWKLNAVDGMISQTDSTLTYENFVSNIIRSYVVSENRNCGYEKYSMEIKDYGFCILEEPDISVTEFDETTCVGSAYTMLKEYDQNGKIISTNKITVNIGENLSETVTCERISANPNTSDLDICYIILAVGAVTAMGIIFGKKRA